MADESSKNLFNAEGLLPSDFSLGQNGEAGPTVDSANKPASDTPSSESGSGGFSGLIKFVAVIALVFVAISVFWPSSKQALSMKEVKQACGVVITYDKDGNETGYGSGFVIGKEGYVATCFHCISDLGSNATVDTVNFVFDYGTEDEQMYPIQYVAAYSQSQDIAIVKIDLGKRKVKPIPLGNSKKLREGQKVYIIGTPNGSTKQTNSQFEAKVPKFDTSTDNIQLSADNGAVAGCSGGVVITRKKMTVGNFEAVGIFASSNGLDQIRGAIPINLIPDNYKGARQLSIADVNCNRRYFKDENGNEIEMGERYFITDTPEQRRPFLKITSEYTSLTDSYAYDSSKGYSRKGLSIVKTKSYYSIADYASIYKYSLRFLPTTDTGNAKWLYSQYNDDGAEHGYGAYLYTDGVGALYKKPTADKPEEGAGIWITRFGETVSFVSYKSGAWDGAVVQHLGDYIYFYNYVSGKKAGEAIRFNFSTSQFQHATFSEDKQRGDWTAIPASDLANFTFTPSSASSGKLINTKQGFSIEWTETGKFFEMQSEKQYAKMSVSEDDKTKFAYSLKSDKEEPYIKAELFEEALYFTAKSAYCTGYAAKDGSYIAQYNSKEKLFADIIIGDKEEWNLGKYTEGLSLNGNGSQYFPRTGELYIGTFSSGKPEGQGAKISRGTYLIQEGLWEDGKLTQTSWDNTVEGKKLKWFSKGMYKVGEDIPAGEYFIQTDGFGSYDIYKDAAGEERLDIETFNNFDYVTVEPGHYIDVSGKFINVLSAPPVQVGGEGTYKVGRDIQPGEYRIIPEKDSGYFAILTDSTINQKIIRNDNFTSQRYISLLPGQYLKVSRALIEPVGKSPLAATTTDPIE